MDQQIPHKHNHNPLPIFSHKQQILSLVRSSQATIICGQTGSGKTTQVPQYLYPHYQSILVTQPRRISAITLAQRVSQQMGYKIGQQIGYNVRFEQKRSNKTKICFMTDGMAIRELMIGKIFDVFVIDEAHERSINTDVLMALLKDKIKNTARTNEKHKNNRYKNLKIIIMSATIQSNKFMNFFQSDSIVRIKGRTYPTQIYNLLQPVQNYLQQTFNAVLQIHYTEPTGDILVFLTGQDQILTLSKKLFKTITEFNISNLQILLLYSALPHEQQHAVFMPSSLGKRKVILATNIAQTSITINGLRYVVDPGFMKIRIYDSDKNIEMLTVVPISKANAMQRSGRAGRQAEGKCYRLYVKGDYNELKEQIIPQILRSQLTGPILQLKAIGIPKISQLQFMDQPNPQTFNKCLTLLKNLKCLTQTQIITPYGIQVSKIPLPPYLSHLLLQSHQHKCQHIMLNALSALSIDNLFYVSKDNRNKNNSILQILKKYMPVVGGSHIYSDHLAKGNILQQYIKAQNKKQFCKGNSINKNNIKRAVQIRQQLQEYLQQIIQARQKKQFRSIVQPSQNQKSNQINKFTKQKLSSQTITDWLKCMESCNINYIAKLNKQGSYTILSSGQIAHIHPQSLLFFIKNKPSLIVFYQVIRTTRLYLRDVSPLINSK